MKLPRSQNQCPHFSTKPCDRPRSENHCPPTDGLGSFEMNGHQDSGTACDASRQGGIPMDFTLPKLYYWRDLLSARIWPVFFGRYDLGCLAHRAAETYRWPKRFSIDLDPSLWSKRPLIAATWVSIWRYNVQGIFLWWEELPRSYDILHKKEWQFLKPSHTMIYNLLRWLLMATFWRLLGVFSCQSYQQLWFPKVISSIQVDQHYET